MVITIYIFNILTVFLLVSNPLFVNIVLYNDLHYWVYFACLSYSLYIFVADYSAKIGDDNAYFHFYIAFGICGFLLFFLFLNKETGNAYLVTQLNNKKEFIRQFFVVVLIAKLLHAIVLYAHFRSGVSVLFFSHKAEEILDEIEDEKKQTGKVDKDKLKQATDEVVYSPANAENSFKIRVIIERIAEIFKGVKR